MSKIVNADHLHNEILKKFLDYDYKPGDLTSRDVTVNIHDMNKIIRRAKSATPEANIIQDEEVQIDTSRIEIATKAMQSMLANEYLTKRLDTSQIVSGATKIAEGIIKYGTRNE